MPKITIHDVARLAGVSISTASKALNHTGRISEETIKIVENASTELGYVANAVGQSLSRRNKKIAIIIPNNPFEVMNCFESGFQQAMEEYSRSGIQFVFKSYDAYSDTSQFEEILRNLDNTINGLIVIPRCNNQTYLKDIKRIAARIPVISLLTPIEEFQGLATVMVNARVVGKIAAEYLCLASRSRKFAVISGNRNGIIHQQNIEGFCDTVTTFDGKVVFIDYSDDQMDAAYWQTEKLLHAVPDIGGIFVTSYVAPGVCKCLMDYQRQEDIAVIGVDLYKETVESLNTGCLNAVIFQNQIQQAYTAVRMMTEYLIQNREVSNAFIKPELIMKSNLECYEWK